MIKTYSQKRKTLPHIHDVTEHADTPEEVAKCLEVCNRVDGKALIVVDKGTQPGYIVKYTIDDRNEVIRDVGDQILVQKVIEDVLGRKIY